MKYKCIPCNHEFEVKQGTKPRCPRCLNIHDIEPVEQTGNPPKSKRSALVPALVIIVAGIVGAIYFSIGKKESDATTEKAADPETLFEKAGIPKDEAVAPCEPKAEVKKLATALAEGKDGQEGMDALFAGINALKDKNKWTPHHQREPRDSRPLTAEELAKKLNGSSDAPWHASSYELACLLFASAEALGIDDVQMVEIRSFKGEKRPADGPGKFGRYAVARDIDPKSTNEVPVYDLFGGRSKTGALAKITVLDKGGAMAPYFGIGALSYLVKQDMSKALSLNDIAIKLDDENPYFRSARGFIFAATGVPTEALVEFEKALKLRSDPVQRINLAEVLMLINPADKRAETEVQAALKDAPDFARAHALKGMLHMVRQEKEQAETELALAERLDPKSPTTAMYWARYYAMTMNSEEAVAKARSAVKLSGDSVSMLIGLASIYRETARFDEMRETLDQILAKMDTPQMADQIKQVFGYDPEPDEDAPSGTDGDDKASGDNSNFKLKLGEGFGGGGLGSDKSPGLGDNLNLDLNMKQ